MKSRLAVLITIAAFAVGGCELSSGAFRYETWTEHPAPGASPRRPAGVASDVPEKTSPESGPAARPDAPLSLDDAVQAALANNPDIRMAVSRIRQAESSLDEANAALLPYIGMNSGYVRADSPSTYLFKMIDSRSFDPATDFNNPGEAGFWDTGVEARYRLFNGGRSVLRRWIAQTGVTIRELDKQVVQNALVASVIETYYNVRAAGAIARAAQASVETVRAERDETRVKFDAGQMLKSDVLTLGVRLDEAMDQAIRAENAQKLSIAALANLLGADADTELTLAEADGTEPTAFVAYHDAVLEALEKRPELLRGRRMVESAAMQVSSEKRAFLPTVDAHARAYWTDPHMSYDADNTNWVVGVELQWGLFEGGARLARLALAEQAMQEMLQADRKTALAVQLDVKSACLRQDEARSRVKVASASVNQAAETLDLVQKQFEGGTATVTRYLEAELMLTQARVREANARYDLRKAVADTERAMGRFAVTNEPGTEP